MSNTRCLGYIRFSSLVQSDGTSEERQLDNIKEYAVNHGLILHEDDIYVDRAVSAFLGKNRKTGKLGEICRQVEIRRDAPRAVRLFHDRD